MLNLLSLLNLLNLFNAFYISCTMPCIGWVWKELSVEYKDEWKQGTHRVVGEIGTDINTVFFFF